MVYRPLAKGEGEGDFNKIRFKVLETITIIFSHVRYLHLFFFVPKIVQICHKIDSFKNNDDDSAFFFFAFILLSFSFISLKINALSIENGYYVLFYETSNYAAYISSKIIMTVIITISQRNTFPHNL